MGNRTGAFLSFDGIAVESGDVHLDKFMQHNDFVRESQLPKGSQGGLLEMGESLQSSFAVLPNHPNPFNPSTRIRYEIPESGNVKATIHNSWDKGSQLWWMKLFLPANMKRNGMPRTMPAVSITLP